MGRGTGHEGAPGRDRRAYRRAAGRMRRQSLERLLGRAAGEKLMALAWNRDPREIEPHRRVQSAGAQSALGRQPAAERVYRPTLRHLADRIATRLRAKSRPGRTVTVRVRFADLRSVTRSITLDAPISATAILAEISEQLVRTVLADHPDETTISLLAISVSHLEEHADLQLEFPLGLEDERRRPGTRLGLARLEGRPCGRRHSRALRMAGDRLRLRRAGTISLCA